MIVCVACDKVPLLAPTQSTVTLSITSTSVPINGTVEVIAAVIEQAGTPVHNGTTVTFTASVGTIEPRDARTEGGVARATFRAGTQSGTAQIGAFSGAARATEVEILVGGAAAQTVAVRLEPSTVPQTGGTVQVIAVVSDVAGNRLAGAPVVFSTDNGTLGSSSAITDANGEARTTLTTNRVSIVRASVADKEGQATVNVVNLPSATLAIAPATPLVGLPVTFTVTPGATTNGNPIQNVILDFGDGKPEANLGAISGATPVQHVYDQANTYTVTLTVIDSSGQRSPTTTTVSVQRPVVNVSVSPSSPTGTIGTPITFTVTVTNSSSVPITGVTVNFGDNSAPVTLGPAGGSTPHTYATSGPFTVTARATDQSGNTYSGQTSVVIAGAAALTVTLDGGTGDQAAPLSCTPGTVYPKTCTAMFIGSGVRAIFTAGCGGGFGGACANATSYQWTFEPGGGGTTTTSNSIDRVFGLGEFRITVTVVTNNGQTGSQYITLIVHP